eukprot:CAMPEP_0113934460 /NCGR_PEP_ID=MMETSP1339-20121228/1784_1 /TAXON_ID=94617 /ORGANISM="Fibrocapsa japonica" /LENGTH=318 /DNA_ID=CAMNT_0000936277 /DNA_START=59 /DNA_END=1015 /DNA_ORIENTATION=- /assembly_acc=CAM_ASM_000762
MQIIVQGLSGNSRILNVGQAEIVGALRQQVAKEEGLPLECLALSCNCRKLSNDYMPVSEVVGMLGVAGVVRANLVGGLKGGIDFQNREGVKFGGGGQMSESQANADRRERLRKLALETIDLAKDPYFMRNHLGTYECKLCLTLHNNEGNYLAHTQGKRHQQNLARRAAMEARDAPAKPQPVRVVPVRRTIKMGRPGYKVTKSRDLTTKQRSLLFEVDYPEAEEGSQPRHRFMSAYEQKVEAPDKAYQYLLFACEPYETIAFKIPNQEIDKGDGRFFTNWARDDKKFTLQLYFKDVKADAAETVRSTEAPPGPPPQIQY